MADEIVIEKPQKTRLVKEVVIEAPPVIASQKFDTEYLRFMFDDEQKKLSMEVNFTTEFTGDTPPNKTRKHLVARNESFDTIFDELFPNDDKVVWTNPQATFLEGLMNVAKTYILK